MRYFILLLATFIFIGCSSKSSSYILPTSSYSSSFTTTNIQIGVKKVEVPSYLNSDKILLKNGVKVEEIDSTFIAPPSQLLTNKTISLLKTSLNNPNVLLYPWDINNKEGYIVEIKVDKFMYDSGNAVIEGSYYIKNANNKLITSKNFRKIEATTKDVTSIVTTLSKLFDTVVIEIARKIAK